MWVHKCGALRDFVAFVQFKKREKQPWRSVTVSKVAEPATLLKVTLLHGCFSRFLNCTIGTINRATHKFFPMFPDISQRLCMWRWPKNKWLMRKYHFDMNLYHAQLRFTCSKSTIAAIKVVWNMFKVTIKTRTTSLTSFFVVFLLLALNK